MSTWTSRAAALLLLPALAACVPAVEVGRAAPERLAVAGSTVVVAGPPGFCVDPSASRDGVKAFVLLGSCASVARDPDGPKPAAPALVTVTVSSDAASFIDVDTAGGALRNYFRSPAGRAALARSGEAAAVDVLDVRSLGGVFYLHARDRSPGAPAGTQDDYWRALLDVNGRLVTVSLAGFTARRIDATTGRRLIESAVARIRAESAGRAG